MESKVFADMHEVFSQLLSFSRAQDEKLCGLGKGLNPQTDLGDIHDISGGWLRVLERIKRDAALKDLTRLAEEDGLYIK